MKKAYHLALITFLISLALVACNGASTKVPVTPQTNNSVSPTMPSGGYPYPQPQYTPPIVSNPGYPGPAVTTAPVIPPNVVVPTPENGLGVVTGQLKVAGQNTPYLGQLYLARTINAKETGVPPMIAYSETTDPSAILDVNGKFVFSGIKPGVYAIIIWNPGGGTPLMDNKGVDHLLVTVEAGKVTDLGVIEVK